VDDAGIDFGVVFRERVGTGAAAVYDGKYDDEVP
jgi:hypothetical protein